MSWKNSSKRASRWWCLIISTPAIVKPSIRAPKFVLGDLKDADAVQHLFDEHPFDGVMHFASHTLVGESMQQPFLYLGDNVTNALNLLRAMIDHNVKRFILSSTANLFDDPERMPIDEKERIVPGSPYGESKFIIERLLYWMDRVHGLRYAALRYFNAAGASPRGNRGEDHLHETHLIPLDSANGAGPAREDHDLRRRLPHARRHVHPRLHPRHRSGAGAHSGAAGAGQRQPHLQPGQRVRLFGERR